MKTLLESYDHSQRTTENNKPHFEGIFKKTPPKKTGPAQPPDSIPASDARIQELDMQITELYDKNKKLTSENERLKTENQRMKEQINTVTALQKNIGEMLEHVTKDLKKENEALNRGS